MGGIGIGGSPLIPMIVARSEYVGFLKIGFLHCFYWSHHFGVGGPSFKMSVIHAQKKQWRSEKIETLSLWSFLSHSSTLIPGDLWIIYPYFNIFRKTLKNQSKWVITPKNPHFFGGKLPKEEALWQRVAPPPPWPGISLVVDPDLRKIVWGRCLKLIPKWWNLMGLGFRVSVFGA